MILHDDGGGRTKLLLKEKIHLADWLHPKGLPKASRVWRGGNDNGVHEVELEDPKPDKIILSIDFESAKEASSPFFLAVTLGL